MPPATPIGTDRLVTSSAAPVLKLATPVQGDTTERPAAATESAPSAAPTADTTTLIGEEDLPTWLRALEQQQTPTRTAGLDDQSWMLGTRDDGEVSVTNAGNLAQSWQKPARPVPQRSSAASTFARVAENAPAPVEQRMLTPEPTPAPAPVEAVPSAAPSPRPNRTPLVPPSAPAFPLQRMAIIALVVAIVLFLIVVGVFIVLPSL